MDKCLCRAHFILIFVLLETTCYEKTLRKIVRSQSKMVQRPFSESSPENMFWRNFSMPDRIQKGAENIFPGYVQTNTVIHKSQRPKISTIISSVETGRHKSAMAKLKVNNYANYFPNDLRLTRNTLANLSIGLESNAGLVSFTDNNLQESTSTNRYPNDNSLGLPGHSKFFPPLDEKGLNKVEIRSNGKENIIIIPESHDFANDSNLLVKGIFMPNLDLSVKPTKNLQGESSADIENDKLDFLIQEDPALVEFAKSSYDPKTLIKPNSCTVLQETTADIDAEEKFSELNIEPRWMTKSHFWNFIFDSRYESLMRNPQWPALKVILIPRTHVDSIWKRSFEQYHNDTVRTILSNIVKKLQFYSNFTFTWNEVSHLSQWWKTTSSKSRSAFRRLVKSGRLEITTGVWVEPDEATTHLFGLVHLLTEGHHWLKINLNYSPTVAWLTNSVTHSPTMAYLLSASGITNLVLTNLHYSWEEFLAEYQYSDFIWLQNWDTDKKTPTVLNNVLNKIGTDRVPKHSVFTHVLQFNSAGFKACGPNKLICANDFNFAKSDKHTNVYSYNIKEKAELLLEQYSKTGTITPHNKIIAPIGGPYRYESQPEFDYQYNNYQKLADYVNSHREIYKATIEFGTPRDYFKTILEKHTKYPTLKGDFLNFADLNSGGKPAYWTGFFTSRPLLKILMRRLQATLRSTEIIFSFAISSNAFQGFDSSELLSLLARARGTVARLLDRNVGSGTITANVLKYVHKLILSTVKDCWYIQEVTASLLSTKPDKKIPYLQKYVFRDGEFITVFRTVAPGDQIYIFNSLVHERTEIVELMVRDPNVRIVDHNRKDVTIQINPVWKYKSDNYFTISRRFYKITFAVAVPPLTFELYKIKTTYDASQYAATLYCVSCVVDEPTANSSILFNIHPVEPGDIQLESYKHRLIFDEVTGCLKNVVEKVTNKEKTVSLNFGAFRSSHINSGMFLFNTNVTKPLEDVLMSYRNGVKSKIVMIVSGQVSTELTCVYGRLLQTTVKIFNLVNSPLSNAIYIETKVDYEVSPKNRELELFLSIETDITNGNPPGIFTDNNGFQYTARVINLTRRIESNMYPMTTMAFIQDRKSRLTVMTDHSQGVTALQEGQLVVMLDRRVLFNDGRGTNEGLADSSATCNRHYILLENFIETPHYQQYALQTNILQLPSLSALHLVDSLNYLLDIFIIEKNRTNLCYYPFLPLLKYALPCDVSLINYRVIFNSGTLKHHTPNTSLVTLHRQGITCLIDNTIHFSCNLINDFSLENLLHNVKAVYQTNLVGTNQGVHVTELNRANFPEMELTTLRIHF